MMRLFFNSTMRAPLSAEPFYIYIILIRRLFVKRFFCCVRAAEFCVKFLCFANDKQNGSLKRLPYEIRCWILDVGCWNMRNFMQIAS